MKKLQIFIIFCVFSTLCYAQTTRPLVSNISAIYSSTNNAVLLSWNVPAEVEESIKELHIFRSEEQFITGSMIDKLTPIVIIAPTITSYNDAITTDGSFYYAIIAKTFDEKLYSVIIPTANATTSPIAIYTPIEYDIPEKTVVIEDEAALREKPLANLQLFDKTNPQEEKITIPSNIIDSTNNLVKNTEQKEFLEPTLLKADITRMTKTQDDGILYAILDDFLENFDWLNFKQELEDFLSIERTENAECRALFYLGQIAYLQKDYRLAIQYFQYAKTCYPIETIKWIDDSLMLLEID